MSWHTVLPLMVLFSAPVVDDVAPGVPPKNARPADTTARRWLSRAEAHLGQLDQSQPSEEAVLFSEYLVGMRQGRTALTLCSQIESVKERTATMIALAGILAGEHMVPEARYVAFLLDQKPAHGNGANEAVSDSMRALYMIATSQAYCGEFDAAKKTIREVSNSKYAASLWYRFAQIQASFGYYDEAITTVEKVKDGEAAQRDFALTEIEKYRVAKAKRSPWDRRHGLDAYLERLRSLAGVFTEPMIRGDKGPLDEQEARASSVQQPSSRASAWREIAWE